MAVQDDVATAYIIDLTGVSDQIFRSYTLPIERAKLQGNQGLINPPIDLTTLAALRDNTFDSTVATRH